ncbi:uncharacterized protein TNCV_4063011 [Trichonephila clavipes]|nr:uncharacterized protein TNCV_4063011 [Trichonephila clavipes]
MPPGIVIRPFLAWKPMGSMNLSCDQSFFQYIKPPSSAGLSIRRSSQSSVWLLSKAGQNIAKSRSGRSKKRRFTGNRYTIRATINENDETYELNSTESASAKKLESSHTSLEIFTERLFETSKDNRILAKNYVLSSVLPFLSKLAFRNQERKLLKATERVAQKNINAALSEIKGSNSFTKCGISIDGTWQRRGYSSLNGCVSAISVDTGKILDIEVMTQYCHICAKGNSQSSKHVCSNYKGSAGNMEVVGAYRIFERSNVRNVQYNEYYGDGDSKGYESVKNFYGINTCPEGSESWCRYQRAKAAGSPLKEIEQGLPNKILNQIKPTYLKLCNETLLKKCLHGKTQNCNESYNNILWNIVPKNIFIGLETFRLGALLALILYNSGYAGILSVIRNVNGSLPESVAQELLKFDKQRISTSLRHSLPIAKLSRKKKSS